MAVEERHKPGLLRDKNFDPVSHRADYDMYPEFLSMAFHYGGRFTISPLRDYIGGQKAIIDWVNFETFEIKDLKTMVVEYGKLDLSFEMSFYFKRPGFDLDKGLIALKSQDDVKLMARLAKQTRYIEVYVEHGQPIVQELGETSNPLSKRLFSDNEGNGGDGLEVLDVTNKPSQIEINETNEHVHNQTTKPAQTETTEPAQTETNEPTQNETTKPAQTETTEPAQTETNEPDQNQANEQEFPVSKSDMINDVFVDMSDFKGTFHRETDINWLGKGVESSVGELKVGEEVVGIDFDVYDSGDGSDENMASRKEKLRKLRMDHASTSANIIKPPFHLSQTFTDKKQVLKILKEHTVESRRDIKLVKNDLERIRATCHGKIPCYSNRVGATKKVDKLKKVDGETIKGKKVIAMKNNCPWKLLVSKVGQDEPWMVKTFNGEHKCKNTRDLRQANSTFLSEHLTDVVTVDPDISGEAVKHMLSKKFGINVNKMQAYRAKDKAVKQLRGDFHAQFGLLRDYILELQQRNPNTTVKLDFEPEPVMQFETRVFRRIYICLGPLKEGFRELSREIIGLDGAFMKGPYPGQVLTAVSVDGNNGVYPVAYALVEAECRDSWQWFLECLGDDLGLANNANFTFISDRQKGILQAVSNIFPSAEHRFCLRHIHENLKTKFRGCGLRELLWFAATRTTVVEFERAMDAIQNHHPQAYDWLKKIPEKTWSRAHFSGRAKCDILLNNICESFNSKLVKGRDKPIISCLEFIREYLMRRIVIVQREIENCKGPLTPRATEILENAKEEAHKVNVVFNGSHLYQVSGPWNEQCVVNMNERKCTCRKWELTGIPCKHAVASIWNMHDNGFDTGEVEDWVHFAYSLAQWEKVYSYKINPIIGTNYWPRSDNPLKILPPKHHTQVGRPKKKRKKGEFENEAIVKDGKLSKKGKTITCSKCRQKGHNAKTCKGQSQNAPPKRATQSKTKRSKTHTSQPMGQPSQPMGQPSQPMGQPSQTMSQPTQTMSQPSQSSARGPKVVHSPKGIKMTTPKFSGERAAFKKPRQA